MMTRKAAGNFTTIGSRVSNPFSNPKYNVSAIGRDKHYYLIKQYENDIAKDLVKSLTYLIKNQKMIKILRLLVQHPHPMRTPMGTR